MAAKKTGLGKGLGALIKEVPVSPAAAGEEEAAAGIRRVPVNQITANTLQPRQYFAPEALQDLVNSIVAQIVSGQAQEIAAAKARQELEL